MIEKYALQVLAGVVTLAAYLAGVVTGDEGLGDVTFQQWLLAAVAVGGAYGITAKAKNTPTA